MNRRGFLRAVGATGLWLLLTRPALLPAAPKKTADELIRRALGERRVVQFKYHGFSRRVEPHALGRVTGDRLALLGWQRSGGSASEPPPGWRTFVLAEIQSLKLLRINYDPRPDYRPETSKLNSITAEAVAESKASP